MVPSVGGVVAAVGLLCTPARLTHLASCATEANVRRLAALLAALLGARRRATASGLLSPRGAHAFFIAKELRAIARKPTITMRCSSLLPSYRRNRSLEIS